MLFYTAESLNMVLLLVYINNINNNNVCYMYILSNACLSNCCSAIYVADYFIHN